MFTELLGGESKPVHRLQQDRALMSLKENLLQNDRSLKDSYFVQTQLSAYNGSQVYHRVLTFLPQKKNPFPTAWQEPSEGFTQINTID